MKVIGFETQRKESIHVERHRATRADMNKAKATIQRLQRQNGRLKVKAYMNEAHFAGLSAEVDELRRRLGLPRRRRK